MDMRNLVQFGCHIWKRNRWHWNKKLFLQVFLACKSLQAGDQQIHVENWKVTSLHFSQTTMIKHQFPFSTSCGIKCFKLERRLVISPIHFISTCHWCAKLFEAAIYMAIPLTGLRWWHRCVSHPRPKRHSSPKNPRRSWGIHCLKTKTSDKFRNVSSCFPQFVLLTRQNLGLIRLNEKAQRLWYPSLRRLICGRFPPVLSFGE